MRRHSRRIRRALVLVKPTEGSQSYPSGGLSSLSVSGRWIDSTRDARPALFRTVVRARHTLVGRLPNHRLGHLVERSARVQQAVQRSEVDTVEKPRRGRWKAGGCLQA